MQEQANSYNNFEDFFYKKIQPILIKYASEYDRLEMEEYKKFGLKILVFVACILMPIIVATIDDHIEIPFNLFKYSFLFLIIALIIAITFKIPREPMHKEAERLLKSVILPVFMSYFGSFTWVNPKGYKFNPAQLKVKNDILNPDEFFLFTEFVQPDDILFGTYKNIPISLFEFCFPSEDHGSRSYYKTLTILEIDKKFKNYTVICPKNHRGVLLLAGKSLCETRLEDTEFNKTYSVFTNDEVEARYLITTSMIERIKNLNIDSEIYFYENKMVILSNTKDLFSISPKSDIRDFKAMYATIDEIFSLVDYLKLDQKIGL